MQQALADDNWTLSVRQIALIRKDMGLRRRVSAHQRQEAVQALWEIIQRELDSGAIQRYGKGHLHVHFKKIFRESGHQLSWFVYVTIYNLA
jgi:hypothetical protein